MMGVQRRTLSRFGVNDVRRDWCAFFFAGEFIRRSLKRQAVPINEAHALTYMRTKKQRLANEAAIIALRRMRENKFAIGSRLGKGAFNHWLVEQLSGLNVNVRYLHTKYMLVDPLGANPLVVSGSANFSEASTTNNDENMLIIRGNPRVADIYLGEFMRLYRHFAFRDWLTQHRAPTKSKLGTWTKRINGGSATLATALNPGNAAILPVRML